MTSPFPPGSSLAAYLRDSGGIDQEMSVPQQRAVISTWASDNNLQIERFFEDVARSGGSVAGREQFAQMIAWLEAGAQVAGVVVWSLNRLARDYEDGQEFLARVRKKGYQIYSLEDGIPPGSVGKIVEALRLWMGEEYRTELSRNVKRGHRFIIENFHVFPSPVAPPGYKKVPVVIGTKRDGSPRVASRLEIDPGPAQRVRTAFEMRAAGATIAEIHERVHIYPGWTQYHFLFRNKIYLGVLVWGGVETTDFCSPIVDPATWEHVQEINRKWELRKELHPRRAESAFLLSGLISCGLCGRAMVGHTYSYSKYSYRYYRCRSRDYNLEDSCDAKNIPVALVEGEVMAQVKEILLVPDRLSALYGRTREGINDRNREKGASLVDLRNELADLNHGLGNLVKAIAAAGHSQALIESLRQMEARRDDLLEQVRQIESELHLDSVVLPDWTTAELERFGSQLWEQIEKGDARIRQRALRLVVQRISVWYDGGELHGEVAIDPEWSLLAMD